MKLWHVSYCQSREVREGSPVDGYVLVLAESAEDAVKRIVVSRFTSSVVTRFTLNSYARNAQVRTHEGW